MDVAAAPLRLLNRLMPQQLLLHSPGSPASPVCPFLLSTQEMFAWFPVPVSQATKFAHNFRVLEQSDP